MMGETLALVYIVTAIFVLGFLRGADHGARVPVTIWHHVASFIAAATWPAGLIYGWWSSRPAAPTGGET